MTKIRLTKEFRFEAAHALLKYDGLCKNIHGHSYILRITIKGSPIEDVNSPKLGMVMDFSELKKMVKNEIVDRFDHSVILNKKAAHQSFETIEDMFDRIHLFDYQPTCENMLVDFVDRIKAKIPNNVELVSVQLYETATSFAEWLAEDN